MIKSIGTDVGVSHGDTGSDQPARGIQAQDTYRKDVISSCLNHIGRVDAPPSQGVQGA